MDGSCGSCCQFNIITSAIGTKRADILTSGRNVRLTRSLARHDIKGVTQRIDPGLIKTRPGDYNAH